MSDLRTRESSSDEGPLVELVEDSRVVGIVYIEDDTVYAEFATDDETDTWAYEVADLQLALDTARAMLVPEALEEEVAQEADDGDPVDRLASEFDAAATHRGEEDEGFYPPQVAGRIIRRCETLGLAVVSIEGLRMMAGEASPIPGMSVDVGAAHEGEPWAVFAAGCNVQALAVLERWAREPGLLLAMEVGDRSDERYVL